jgi:hypothetical protein
MPAMKACEGMEVRLISLLTSAQNGGDLSASRPDRFTPDERDISIYCI